SAKMPEPTNEQPPTCPASHGHCRGTEDPRWASLTAAAVRLHRERQADLKPVLAEKDSADCRTAFRSDCSRRVRSRRSRMISDAQGQNADLALACTEDVRRCDA